MLFTVPTEKLDGLGGNAISDQLEQAQIVYFPTSPISLPSQEDLDFLRNQLAVAVVRKNVSYYPEAERLVGLQTNAEVVERVRMILRTYGSRVQEFLTRAMPNFFRGCRTGTTSFRPFEERGRGLK